MILGIDEAGRGAVIGPLVIAGVVIDSSSEEYLKEEGVRDSKELSESERERLFNVIKEVASDIRVVRVTPREIDMYRSKNKLNLLEAEKMAEIINSCFNVRKIYIDSPQNNAEKFTEVIKSMCSLENKEVVVEAKADKKYVAVSCASIVAKVIRDREIEKIRKETGIDVGKGYPSDERTINSLKIILEKYPQYVRKSWVTVEKIKQKNLFNFLYGV